MSAGTLQSVSTLPYAAVLGAAALTAWLLMPGSAALRSRRRARALPATSLRAGSSTGSPHAHGPASGSTAPSGDGRAGAPRALANRGFGPAAAFQHAAAWIPALRSWRPSDAAPVLCAAACLAGGGLLAVWARSLLPLLGSLALAPWAARRYRRSRLRQEADARRDAVIDFCAALAGEVQAGRTPEQALLSAGIRGLGPAASALPGAARSGADVPAAFRRAAEQPGAGGLLGVAACWQVAVDGGASLATGLDRVARALRAERDQREDLDVQLAGPRATVRILAALPPAGLLLGTTMGAAPLQVLFGTRAGLGCLAAGLALEGAGLAWASAILRSATRRAVR